MEEDWGTRDERKKRKKEKKEGKTISKKSHFFSSFLSFTFFTPSSTSNLHQTWYHRVAHITPFIFSQATTGS